MTQGLALVDYDNLRRLRPKSSADFEEHATDLIDGLVRALRAVFPDLQELDVRFYSGWTDEAGLPSRDALWLVRTLAALRGRRAGVIVRPSFATSMLQFPTLLLRGTVRLQSGKPRQKMVDGMLGCDAMFAAAEGLTRVAVVTDDEDLVPAMLSAHAANPTLTVWMRLRKVGTGLNDRVLARTLRIQRIEENHGGAA